MSKGDGKRSGPIVVPLPVERGAVEPPFQWLFLLVLAVSSWVLGYLGFQAYFARTHTSKSFWDISYLTLQLFSVESGAVAGPVPRLLGIARFTAPLVTLLAVLKALAIVFREQQQAVRLMLARNHAIVCGLNRRSLDLVRDFRRLGWRVVVIDQELGGSYARSARESGALVLPGRLVDEPLLRRARVQRAAHAVIMSEDEGDNVEDALMLSRVMAGVRRRRHAVPLVCHVQIGDLRLCELLRHGSLLATPATALDFHIFNAYENAVRLLLRDNPPDRRLIQAGSHRRAHVIVVGLGQTGESMVLQVAGSGRHANGLLPAITVLDLRASEKRASLLARYPRLPEVCELEFHEGAIEDPVVLARATERAFQADAIPSLVICINDDSRSLICALTVQRMLEDREIPIFVRMATDAGLTTLFNQDASTPGLANLRVFGTTSSTGSVEAIIDEPADALARVVYAQAAGTVERPAGHGEDAHSSAWEGLHAVARHAYRLQADHIAVKLNAIGCVTVPDDQAEAVTEFTPDEVGVMARMEHARRSAASLLACTSVVTDSSAPVWIPWTALPAIDQEAIVESVRQIPTLLAQVGESIRRRTAPIGTGKIRPEPI